MTRKTKFTVLADTNPTAAFAEKGFERFAAARTKRELTIGEMRDKVSVNLRYEEERDVTCVQLKYGVHPLKDGDNAWTDFGEGNVTDDDEARLDAELWIFDTWVYSGKRDALIKAAAARQRDAAKVASVTRKERVAKLRQRREELAA